MASGVSHPRKSFFVLMLVRININSNVGHGIIYINTVKREMG